MFPSPARGTKICAFGELIQDQLCVTDDALALNGQVDGLLSYHRGGCAPNVLATVAALGAPARFLGHFGADAVSTNLAENLQHAGVRMFGIRRGRGASSLCVQTPDGGTLLVFDPADSRSMRPADIRRWWLKDAAVLHLNSHHLYAEETVDAFWRLVAIAQDMHVPISLDVSAANGVTRYGVDKYREDLRRIRPAVLMANAYEAEALSLHQEYPEGADVVITHQGPGPTLVSMNSTDSWEVPVPPCDDVVDTVGAGDVFAGGFLVGWLQGRSLRASVELGHEVAVQSVQQYGVEVPAERPSALLEVS